MKKKDLLRLVLLEIALALAIGIIGFDFLPSNYKEFKRICDQSWSHDPAQYKTCMDPYYNQIGLDKYLIGAGVATLVVVPIVYLLKKEND